MLIVLASPDPAASAPPPTIYTQKTNALCNAIRDVIAPALAVTNDQDIGLGVSSEHMGGNAIAAMHLGNNVLRLADDNIRENQLLDKLVLLDLNNDEKRDVSTLEQRMRKVAKLQNDALNQLSGPLYTDDFNQLEQVGVAVMDDQDGHRSFRLPPMAPPGGGSTTRWMPSMWAVAYRNMRILQKQIAQQEDAVGPALEPIAARCRN